MKIKLDGKTQVEIENMFSMASIKESLQIAVDMFINEVDDKHIDILKPIVKDDAQELMESIIAIIGNPFIYYKEEDGFRWTPAKALAKGISKINVMKKHFDDLEHRMFHALDILKLLDGILYDIEYLNVKIEKKYYKIAHCKIGFQLDPWVSELPFLKLDTIPLIEKPMEWNEHQSGGYHLIEQKPTLKLGASEQPQNVLDVLNILQGNKFKLLKDSSSEEFYDYFIEKMLLKYDYQKSDEIARLIAKSIDLIFESFKDFEFYFQWKYDFRGRIYSNGYAINLQSDKYRKGIITPTITGRVTIN